MICIILVAGHGTLLEREIKDDDTGKYTDLQGVPKALLPGVGNKCILDFWWDAIKMRQLFVDVFLVTNADKYKYYERWATAHDFPVENIVNDGTTTVDTRINAIYQKKKMRMSNHSANGLGAVADFELVLRTKSIQDDVMVVAGDMLFQDRNFDIAQVIKYFKLKKGEVAIYYEMDDTEQTETRGIVEVCSSTNRIQRFLEKPKADQTSSRLASVVFYCFQKQTLGTIGVYLKERADMHQRGFGSYMEWLVNQTPVYGMKLPTGFQLIGQVGLLEYEKWVAYFSKMTESGTKLQPFTARAYARIGLMGNPSDGFNGKTISLSIANFWAEVTIQESQQLVLVPHPLNDPTEFGSLGDLHGISRKEGYLGGLRLLQATCKKFYQYCYEKGIALAKKNFTLKYDTNIPRQVGLAGSSAIVTATLRCLMNFYNITEKDIAKPLQPKFVLGVEMDELFIQAGLQDRVIQVYEGLVYMDFSVSLIDEQGHGDYMNLDITCAPNLWLAYHTDPSDSGRIHSNVRLRWNQGDPVIIAAMQQFAELTDLAKNALIERDYERLSNLMNQNFDLRRSIYGDEALGQTNLRMIELARQFGSSAKFPGSGGAIIGLCQDYRHLEELKRAFQAEGFVVCDIVPYSLQQS